MVPHFSLRQLAYLVAVAEAGSMTAAAEAEHVSQAAISTGITDLERHLGVRLLHRRPGHGVSLTEEGSVVLTDARRALSAAVDVQVRARSPRAELRGPVSLGCYRTMAPHHLPALHQAVIRMHPALELTVMEGGQDELRRALSSGACEVLLTYGNGIGAGLEIETLAELTPYLLVSADHPLAGRQIVELAELGDEVLIEYALEPSPSNLEHLLHQSGVRPRRVLRSMDIEVVRSLVARGVGYATMLQTWPTPTSLEGLPLASVPLHRSVPDYRAVLAWPEGKKLSRRAAAVVDLIRTTLRWGTGTHGPVVTGSSPIPRPNPATSAGSREVLGVANINTVH